MMEHGFRGRPGLGGQGVAGVAVVAEGSQGRLGMAGDGWRWPGVDRRPTKRSAIFLNKISQTKIIQENLEMFVPRSEDSEQH